MMHIHVLKECSRFVIFLSLKVCMHGVRKIFQVKSLNWIFFKFGLWECDKLVTKKSQLRQNWIKLGGILPLILQLFRETFGFFVFLSTFLDYMCQEFSVPRSPF